MLACMIGAFRRCTAPMISSEEIPEVAGTSEVAKRITESGLEMADRVVNTHFRLLREVANGTQAGLSLPRPSPPPGPAQPARRCFCYAGQRDLGSPGRSVERPSLFAMDDRLRREPATPNAERREDRSVQTRSGRCRHRTKGPRPRASELRRPVPRTTTADYCGCRASGRSVESVGGTGGQKRLVQITNSDSYR